MVCLLRFWDLGLSLDLSRSTAPASLSFAASALYLSSFSRTYYQNADVCVSKCFEEICWSFDNKKPAIINSHRFNYIGTINSKNAENNLKGLYRLLKQVKERYPDIEFVSSSELIDIIRQEDK